MTHPDTERARYQTALAEQQAHQDPYQLALFPDDDSDQETP